MEVPDNNIKESTTKNIYLVKSSHYKDKVYEINTTVWTCTCSISLTGYPSGEPCKHQHAVANKFNLVAPNLIPYFNGDGRFLYALVALGVEQVGDKSFYMGMNEEFHRQSEDNITHNDEDDNTTIVDDNSADENLSFALNFIDEGEALQEDVGSLCRKFIEDVQSRMQDFDIQYLTGLKKFFSTYMGIINKVEPINSATPRLASLLHTYFSSNNSSKVAGTRQIAVQPTAVSRRRSGISRGSKLAPSGRPPKRKLEDADVNIQKKRGRSEHTKRKQNLKQNELKNCANHFKHGRGH